VQSAKTRFLLATAFTSTVPSHKGHIWPTSHVGTHYAHPANPKSVRVARNFLMRNLTHRTRCGTVEPMTCQVCLSEANDPYGARHLSVSHTWRTGCQKYEDFLAFIEERYEPKEKK
jgi:hypothetical protein